MNITRPHTVAALAAAAVLLLLLCTSTAAGSPDAVSDEQYVTLIHDQDGQVGCVGQSVNHILEILKEKEAPYTPDPSDGFHSDVFNCAFFGGNDPRVPPDQTMFDPYALMAIDGAAPETSYSTNFDLNGQDSADIITHPPSDTAFEEAQAYRLNNDPVYLYSPTVPLSEEWIATRGPVVCNGLFPDHAVALIGYNRTAGEFTIVDSANWQTPYYAGVKRVTYAYFTSRLNNMWLVAVTNRPTPLIHPVHGADPDRPRVPAELSYREDRGCRPRPPDGLGPEQPRQLHRLRKGPGHRRAAPGIRLRALAPLRAEPVVRTGNER